MYELSHVFRFINFIKIGPIKSCKVVWFDAKYD